MGASSPTCTQPSRRANTCKVVPGGTVRNTAEPVGTSRMFAPWRVITLPTSVGGAGAGGTTPRCCSTVIPFTSAPASSYSRVAVGAVNGAVPRFHARHRCRATKCVRYPPAGRGVSVYCFPGESGSVNLVAKTMVVFCSCLVEHPGLEECLGGGLSSAFAGI
jgi:hypothetical protein